MTLQFRDQAILFGLRKREFVRPEFRHGVVCRTFMRRNIAARHPDGLIKGRITSPRLEHAMIEIEAIHFSTNDVPINLLLDRPAGWIQGIEPRPQL